MNKNAISFFFKILILVLAVMLTFCMLSACDETESPADGITEAPTSEAVDAGSDDGSEVTTGDNACKHTAVTDEGVLPTCTQAGLTQGEHCADCGEILVAQEAIPALGHTLELVPEISATCTQAGLTQGEHCSACGEILLEQQTIPALGHTIVVDEEIPAACTQPGLSRGERCSACGSIILAQEPTLPKGHKYSSPVFTWNAFEAVAAFVCENNSSHKQTLDASVTSEITLAPTSDTNGVRTYTATVEFEGLTYTDTKTEILSSFGHSFEFVGWVWNGYTAKAVLTCRTEENHEEYIEGHITSRVTVEPTCTAVGTRVYTASVSFEGKTYSDTKQEEIPVTEHSIQEHAAKAPECTSIGWEAYETCTRCDYTTYKELSPIGHDEISHAAQAATCTEGGYQAYVTCSRCDYTTYKVTQALGHAEISHAAQTATCTEGGYQAYVTCSRCDYTTYKATPALGHAEISHAAQEATCTEGGYAAYVNCTRCSYTTYKATAALGHDEVSRAAQTATCTEGGHVAYVSCSRCSYTTYLATPALGHDTVSNAAKAPTCTQEGWNKYETCTRCDYSTYEDNILSKLAHTYESIFDENCMVCSESRKIELITSVSTVGANGSSKSFSSVYAGTELGDITVTQKSGNSLVFSGIIINDNATLTAAGSVSSGSVTGYGYFVDGSRTSITRVSGDSSFNITANVNFSTTGTHTLTFVAFIGDDYAVEMMSWSIPATKPIANVIVIAGQSNAYGASPITSAMKEKLQNKAFPNVYIHFNNINVVTSGTDGVWQTLASNSSFEQFRLGVGGQNINYMGPEVGIVNYLVDNGYTDDAPLYIIKYTAAGTFLNGQWLKTSGTNNDPYGLVSDLGNYLYPLMVDYVNSSLDMIPDKYTPEIKSFFWVQGESDARDINTANQYQTAEQLLVSNFRTDFASYAAASGISFIDYAIQVTPENPVLSQDQLDYYGPCNWVYASTVNAGKQANSAYYYDRENSSTTQSSPGVTSNPGITNSYLVIADDLLSKGAINEDPYGTKIDNGDCAHLSCQSMFELGEMMGAGMLFLENQNS